MAQYKVPQDVEADDKLLGPFSFRQFIYLLIVAALCAIAWFLAQIFWLLFIIPLPFIIFFGALALPIRKDQPMETYLAAVISYYLKPHTRYWVPGQRESVIQITAPKIVEAPRTRNISQEEAGYRLSFLADIVDSEGRSIKNNTSMSDDVIAEASATADIFEKSQYTTLDSAISRDTNARHQDLVNQMRQAIDANHANLSSYSTNSTPTIQKHSNPTTPTASNVTKNIYESSAVVLPDSITGQQTTPSSNNISPARASFPQEQKQRTQPSTQPAQPVTQLTQTPAPIAPRPATPAPQPTPQPIPKPAPKPSMVELSKNKDYSIATISKEASRINQTEEVYISLH